jgi:ABC-type branched-subunit amino acid transport system ATPase component
MLLELRNLVKRFDGLTVIDDVSFSIPAGRRTALIGPNGAGKTMLFNLITGVYPASSGEIRLDGVELSRVPPVQRVRHGLARTFQNVRLIGHLTALENVMLGQHHRAGSSLETILFGSHNRWMVEAREALYAAGLEKYADVLVRHMPFGVRKQVEVARAMMARPKLLLLDEPAAGLNPAETNELRRQLDVIAAGGVTILVIEHDMGFVGDFCEAVIVLNFGRKLAEGTPDEIRRLPTVREAYLGGDLAIDV